MTQQISKNNMTRNHIFPMRLKNVSSQKAQMRKNYCQIMPWDSASSRPDFVAFHFSSSQSAQHRIHDVEKRLQCLSTEENVNPLCTCSTTCPQNYVGDGISLRVAPFFHSASKQWSSPPAGNLTFFLPISSIAPLVCALQLHTSLGTSSSLQLVASWHLARHLLLLGS